jgi:hypothetical protein
LGGPRGAFDAVGVARKGTAQQRDQQICRGARSGLVARDHHGGLVIEDEDAAVAVDLDVGRSRHDVDRAGHERDALRAGIVTVAAADEADGAGEEHGERPRRHSSQQSRADRVGSMRIRQRRRGELSVAMALIAGAHLPGAGLRTGMAT